MDNEVDDDICSSPLLEYGIMKLVLESLPNVQELNKAARVCKAWSEAAKIIKRSRNQIYVTANNESHEDIKNVEELLSKIKSEPKLCITFLTHENYDEVPSPLNDSEDSEDNRTCSVTVTNKGRYSEYMLLKYLHENLPRDSVIVGGISCGVVMSAPSLETSEVEDGNAFGLLLLPELSGVTIENFYWNEKEMKKAILALSSHDSKLLNALTSENIKCLLIFGSDARKESRCIEGLCRHLQEKKNADIAIGGGFVEAVIHPEVVDRERECGLMGIVISGSDVHATSVVIPDNVRDESDIENIFKKVTQNHTQTKESRKRRSIAFMFACVARGTHLHGRPGVESTLFRKHFPSTPLVGFFGNGEIGVNNVDLIPKTHAFRTPHAYVPPKRARPSLLHSYSTVFVVISFPVD